MLQSTHYQLNLAEGSDIVNPLIIDRPNYEKIDGQMYKNQEASIQLATELYDSALKVHALTMLTTSTVFRFIATSKYSTGDTFTVNGTQVTALLPSGETLSDGAYVINSTVICALNGTVLTFYLGSGVVTEAEDSKLFGGQPPEYYGTKVEVEASNALAQTAVDIANEAKRASGLDIIWRNDTPTVEFAPQTIALDNLNQYRFVRVYFHVANTNKRNYSIELIVADGEFSGYPLVQINSNNRVQSINRQCTIASGLSGIAFSECTIDLSAPYARSTDNKQMIPIMIVGVK